MENQDELVWVALWMIGIVGILILTLIYKGIIAVNNIIHKN
jgi:hypothetical protein